MKLAGEKKETDMDWSAGGGDEAAGPSDPRIIPFEYKERAVDYSIKEGTNYFINLLLLAINVVVIHNRWK